MNKNFLHNKFGSSRQRVENALSALKNGQGVLVLDDENRENEGDMIFAAENMTISQMALAIRFGSGIICICLTKEKCRKLNLPMMVQKNNSKYQTAFTVSIESASGITTGVSAYDRLKTIKTAIRDNAKPEDLHRPGHVFPLRAKSGGVLCRAGHTEAAIDLTKLAGLNPSGVICEVMNDDGSMAKMPEILHFSYKTNMPVLIIKDIISYRLSLK
ncbi:hypothetical protein GQX74_015781 [Glossina fuscipes]|uniref:3,4-dihydroxy-2-butanone 4-phosphate synthase n=1 Tax=Glossina palpalis gambiensis TaxID=67801 RepID=A0A1B0C130_9MUSC|nr:hypothetical protein GQX74_015781 [Glossina fuscipes]MDQ1237697.1 3,4-dihydroxy-2-butanone 4-phosphate synthase-like [Wigglesworthia glossinidia]